MPMKSGFENLLKVHTRMKLKDSKRILINQRSVIFYILKYMYIDVCTILIFHCN